MGDVNEKEIWKRLIYQGKEYDALEVSTHGRLRNVITETIYKFHTTKNGYLIASITFGSRQSKKTFRAHKCVAETFIPNPDNKPSINHIDGNKTNNNVSNLEWVTNKENSAHAWKNNLSAPHKSANRKLTEDEIAYIRSNYVPMSRTFGARPLARKFNVHHSTVQSILKNETYVI